MYRLLLVDDSKQITDEIKYLLPWNKYMIDEIRTANTYEEALELGESWRPDVAIISVCIADKFGYDLHMELRKELPDLCTIIMSDRKEISYVRKSMHAGCVDYLMKPPNKPELQETMDHYVMDRLAGNCLKKLSGNTEDILGDGFPEKFSRPVLAIIKITQEEYRKNLNLSVLGQRVKLSSGYLGKLFIKETGMKFSRFLMRYRMNVAKDLLMNTDYKVSYIARMTGYTNMNYFYRHFRDCYKKQPSEFRRL